MMPTAETLRALLALVEEAKAGNRELDGQLTAAFDPPMDYAGEPADIFIRMNDDDCGVFKSYVATPASYTQSVPPLTTSIDAALALVAKALRGATWAIHPGWGDDIPEGEARGYEASVGGSPDCGGPWTRHDTPPLAIITGLLAALLQQSETAHVER